MTLLDLADIVRLGRTALILQEVQNGVLGEDSTHPDLAAAAAAVGVVPNAIRLADAARRAGIPVIHTTAENLPGGFGTNHNARVFAKARKAGAENKPGSRSVQPVEGVCGPDDVILPRYHGLSPMTGGPLDSLLRNAGITTIVLAGVSLNVALPNLTFDAVNRSYRVVIVKDAVAGVPAEYGEQVLRNTLRQIATVCTTGEVTRAWDEGPG